MTASGRADRSSQLLDQAEKSVQKAISRRGATKENIEATRAHIQKIKSSNGNRAAK